MLQAEPNVCPACRQSLAATRHDWLWRCAACEFLCSNLDPDINARDEALDEVRREDALSTLRSQNFEAVLDTLAAAGLDSGGSILDVGCAHGWFLEKAAARGFHCVGVEPDLRMADIADRSGLDIRRGFFPGALGQSERFNAVVFNDVLEHVPDIGRVATAVAEVLRPGGLLAVNLPLSTGTFYRLADLMDKSGVGAPFVRMWQKGFPSPHLSYLNQDNLARLMAAVGLEEVTRSHLPSVVTQGLWQRLTYDRAMSMPAACVVYAGLRLASPLLPLLPPDIGLQVFAKPGQR